jgi:hypothetical protein
MWLGTESAGILQKGVSRAMRRSRQRVIDAKYRDDNGVRKSEMKSEKKGACPPYVRRHGSLTIS